MVTVIATPKEPAWDEEGFQESHEREAHHSIEFRGSFSGPSNSYPVVIIDGVQTFDLMAYSEIRIVGL